MIFGVAKDAVDSTAISGASGGVSVVANWLSKLARELKLRFYFIIFYY